MSDARDCDAIGVAENLLQTYVCSDAPCALSELVMDGDALIVTNVMYHSMTANQNQDELECT